MTTNPKKLEKIQKRNESFKKETPAEKRVSIARDALEWIHAGALRPKAGTYIQPAREEGRYVLRDAHSREDGNVQLRDLKLGACHVCGIGALFVAKAVRYDAATAGHVGDMHGNLSPYFTQEQMALVENFFERRDASPFFSRMDEANIGTAYRRGSLSFMAFCARSPWAHLSAPERLVAILENIIENAGTFKPRTLAVFKK